MSISNISRFASAAVLSVMAVVTIAAADASASSFIGPKGGDTRKVVPIVNQAPGVAQGFVVEGGTNTAPLAKGDAHQSRAFPRWTAPASLSDRPAVAQDLTRPIGPKGGPTRRGL
jgi:hypothetical protein